MAERHLRLIAFTLLVASPLGAANAETLYRWFDNDGVPHFGDQPPPNGAERVQELPAPEFASSGTSPAENHYSINNQLRRMKAARQTESRERWQREQERREYELRKRELEAQQNAVAPAPTPSAPVYAYPRAYYPRYPQPPSNWPNPNQRPRSLWQPDSPVYSPYPSRPHHRTPPPTTGSRIGIDRGTWSGQ